MDVAVTVEHRFRKTPDESIWTQTAFAYPFWIRYLEVFDGVRVVARVESVDRQPSDWIRADGPGVSFVPLPYYVGPWEYLMRSWAVRANIFRSIGPEDAVILRVPSNIGTIMAHHLWACEYPYAVEVVGDPYDVFAPGAVRHPLRPVFRQLFSRRLRAICSRAVAAAYVTEEYLQRRYPPSQNAYTISCSDVQLPPEAFAVTRRQRDHKHEAMLISVGSLAQPYKGFDVLIEAVALCVHNGLDLGLVLLGDGRYRSSLEALRDHRGLKNRVYFRGQLPAGEGIRAELDDADVFVLPSLTEGLPRAMLEAMARGLPCIGSSVGGIPELIPCDDTFPAGDPDALAEKIMQVVTDGSRMAAMSERSLETAKKYRDDILAAKRRGFYSHVRSRTRHWHAPR